MPSDPRPWYREPMVLLVIAGPLLVVVASFITLGLAIRHPDPPLRVQAGAAEEQPAVAARNHAATGGKR